MMRRLLALSVAGVLGSLGAAGIANSVAMTSAAPQRRGDHHVPTARYSGYSFTYPSGPGWTVAQAKRRATKRRNQINAKRRKS